MEKSKETASNAEENVNVSANYIHKDYLIETLVRLERITAEDGDAFKGFQTEGMSQEKIIIFLWSKHFRICRLLLFPSVKDMADPKVASISSLNSFERERPLRFDNAISMIHQLFTEKGCESSLYKAMELISFAKIAKCNVDVILSQDGTNRRASKPSRIFSIKKNENNTTTEEQDEEGQYWDEQDWEKKDVEIQDAVKQSEKDVPTVRRKNPGPKPLL